MAERGLAAVLKKALKGGGESDAENGTGLAHTTAAPEDQGDLFAAEADPAALALPERKGGRPKGARNLKSRDLVKMMEVRGFRDPILFLADVYSRPVSELKTDLGLDSTADAFAFQIKAAEAVAPYVHAKRTPTAPETPKAPTFVLIQTGGEGGAKEGGPIIDGDAMRLDIQESPDKENQ